MSKIDVEAILRELLSAIYHCDPYYYYINIAHLIAENSMSIWKIYTCQSLVSPSL